MPTSPVSTPEIEDIFGDELEVASRTAPAPSMADEWWRFAGFLKRPSLEVGEQSASPIKVLVRIYMLDMCLMFMLILAASIAVASGVYLPETALAGIEFTPLIILSVIVGAPVFEELLFRGWLSGRPAHVLALLSMVIGATGFGVAHATNPLLGTALGALGLAGAILAIVTLRRRSVFGWYARFFPAFFWFATLSFALVHLANFDEGSLAILLPLVLPQFILGTMLGYLRVRIGLWAAILLHALHNATALGIAALASLAQS